VVRCPRVSAEAGSGEPAAARGAGDFSSSPPLRLHQRLTSSIFFCIT
jgi:hypothetical protein